ncbi:MAG: LuxR family transcriptional regulator, partial [Gemmobacter sp.]
MTGLVAVQALAAVFFAADAAADVLLSPWTAHTLIEVFVAFALGAGVVVGAVELRAAIERSAAQDAALAAARGALAEVVAAQFRDWALTPAETDVAWLALKGLDVAEIAG